MQVLTHLIVSIIIAIGLYPFYGIMSFLAVVSGFLIDLDHVIVYFFIRRSWSLPESMKYFNRMSRLKRQEIFKDMPFYFHSIELLLAVAVAACLYEPLMPGLAALVAHHIMDMIQSIHSFKEQIKFPSLFLLLLYKFRKAS